RKLTDRGLRDNVTIHQDDIRDMHLDSDSFDAVLCLGGPLSHVTDADEREDAASELQRVARSGAPVLVSVMGFYGLLVLAAVEQWGFIYEYEDFLERQTYDDRFRELTGEESSFADTYFFKPQQLRELLEEQGLTVEKIVGLEPVASALDKEEGLDDAFKEQLRGLAGELHGDTASPYLSNHLLAVARNR
ncbi:MAG: class I SAM-dependent methyltransferase, partial [Candidatus Nanohaloarchaea archaeon]|nr:class I SAM-dependent methyltransferase [Candidatus Nanohaloarchaea archaeon]